MQVYRVHNAVTAVSIAPLTASSLNPLICAEACELVRESRAALLAGQSARAILRLACLPTSFLPSHSISAVAAVSAVVKGSAAAERGPNPRSGSESGCLGIGAVRQVHAQHARLLLWDEIAEAFVAQDGSDVQARPIKSVGGAARHVRADPVPL